MAPISNESGENLLSSPKKEAAQEFERQQVQYEDLSIDFNDKLIDFSKQFCHIYSVRLAELKAILIPRIIAKWGKLCITVFYAKIFYLSIGIICNKIFVHKYLVTVTQINKKDIYFVLRKS